MWRLKIHKGTVKSPKVEIKDFDDLLALLRWLIEENMQSKSKLDFDIYRLTLKETSIMVTN